MDEHWIFKLELEIGFQVGNKGLFIWKEALWQCFLFFEITEEIALYFNETKKHLNKIVHKKEKKNGGGIL